jgi:hypothetical protein
MSNLNGKTLVYIGKPTETYEDGEEVKVISASTKSFEIEFEDGSTKVVSMASLGRDWEIKEDSEEENENSKQQSEEENDSEEAAEEKLKKKAKKDPEKKDKRKLDPEMAEKRKQEKEAFAKKQKDIINLAKKKGCEINETKSYIGVRSNNKTIMVLSRFGIPGIEVVSEALSEKQLTLGTKSPEEHKRTQDFKVNTSVSIEEIDDIIDRLVSFSKIVKEKPRKPKKEKPEKAPKKK